MSDIDPSKMKVTELRDELKKHGLDTKGKKEQLVKRLEKFLSGGEGDASLNEADNSLSQETSLTEEPSSQDAESASQEEVADSQTEPAADEPPAAEPPAAEPAVQESEPMSTTEAEPAAAPAEEAAVAEEKPAEAEEEQKMDDTPAESAPDTTDTSAAPATESETPAADSETPTAESETPAAESAAVSGEQKPESESTEGGDRRKRSRSRDRSSHREGGGHSNRGDSPNRKRDRRDEPPQMESLDWVEKENVQLDRYNCDLNCECVNDGFTIKPQSYNGFGYMWAGCRANYGITDGKVAFQMKSVKNLRIQIGEESIGANHVARVGWSVDGGDYQLGEYPKSWGYGGTAKFSTNSVFTDFNVKFYNMDCVTCYLDMTGENVIMYFAKNDMAMEKAVEFPKSDLEGAPLFPAFATKNQIIDVNFGQLEKPWYPLLGEEGEYTFINDIPLENRTRSVKPPATKEECDVLLLIGLPGSGKSYWASQKQKTEPEKRYYVLGTNNIIDKMKVDGLPRKNNYHGRWDVLFDQANDCLRKMLENATKRYKNYVLDQTNVYDTAQRRKMRPFAGFKRKAVVVLPTDKVFRERIEKRTKEEGKEVPETAVLEMKANFSCPTAAVEVALNPEANELAVQEAKEEAERLAKEEEERKVREAEEKVEREKKEAEEKEAAEQAKLAAAEEAAAAGENGETETAAVDESSEVKEESVSGEEKAAADAAETEKPAEAKEEPKSEPEIKQEPEAEEKMETSEAPPTSTTESDVKAEATVKTETTEQTETTEKKDGEGESTTPTAEGDKKEETTAEGEEKKAEGEEKAEEKKVEPEIVFEEILFTELSGDMARELLAKYIKEGQVKFPPGSRRFRREDRRIGKDADRGGYRDYRDGGYRDGGRRDGGNRGGYRYGSSSGNGGGYNQNRGYDNRNRSYGGGYSNRGGGGGGGYRSGGSYGKSYGGGNWGNSGWGGQQGGWGNQQGWGNQGWGNQNSWGQGYNNQGWGGYNQGYNSQGYGNQSYGQGSWGGGQQQSGSSWNQQSGGYNSGYQYNQGSGGSGY